MRTCFGRRVFIERGRCKTGIVAGRTVLRNMYLMNMFPESQASINVSMVGKSYTI
jgi:hypothetical protein